ncbi:hypothetical protein [Streptosporangium sandarakinum]|uniref:hypothetical protein n=1 Tax=Streptosporangium sandarakinum TaxID=1260955 RepID=UPI0037139F67
MIDLTDEFLQPAIGTLRFWPAHLDSPVAGTWSISIPLAPFSADDEYDPATYRPGTGGPELVETEITLDFITLPAEELTGLSRRSFPFPVNPAPRYIDGSIYLIAAHCPVNVTRIEFGPATGDHIQATLDASFDFAAAGGIDIHNRTATLTTTLQLKMD